MSEMSTVKDLAIGDVIQVDGFDGNLTVRSAKKIKKGLDAGKLQVTLVTTDGETEAMAFDPEERVQVVAKDTEGVCRRSADLGSCPGRITLSSLPPGFPPPTRQVHGAGSCDFYPPLRRANRLCPSGHTAMSC
jgi:hypothetical protein